MKKLKVTWNGKKMCEVYPHATRWQVLKFKVARFMRKLGWCFVSVGFLWLVYLAGTFFGATERILFLDREVKVDTLSTKVRELKEEVLDGLKACESGGAEESAGLIIYDSNKVASIGSYQFQVKTIIYYYKTLYDKEITKKEAVLIALDDVRARELASDIIFKADGLKNWLNCANKNNLRSGLNIIESLQ